MRILIRDYLQTRELTLKQKWIHLPDMTSIRILYNWQCLIQKIYLSLITEMIVPIWELLCYTRNKWRHMWFMYRLQSSCSSSNTGRILLTNHTIGCHKPSKKVWQMLEICFSSSTTIYRNDSYNFPLAIFTMRNGHSRSIP